MCCSVLQYVVAVCCSVLQCVAVCCSKLLQCVAVCCSVLQCVAASCSKLHLDILQLRYSFQVCGLDQRKDKNLHEQRDKSLV